MHTCQGGSIGFEHRQACCLVVIAQRRLPLLPRISSFGEQMVIQPAALLKLAPKEALLLLVRVQPALDLSPCLKAGDSWAEQCEPDRGTLP